jgi:hypothetical protein
LQFNQPIFIDEFGFAGVLKKLYESLLLIGASLNIAQTGLI